jgi:hypothetical protein
MIIFNCERTQCKFFGNNFFLIIHINRKPLRNRTGEEVFDEFRETVAVGSA